MAGKRDGWWKRRRTRQWRYCARRAALDEVAQALLDGEVTDGEEVARTVSSAESEIEGVAEP